MGIPVIWKDVVGFEGLYQVSNTGKIKSLFRYKKELKPNITKRGYATVELFKNKRSQRLLVHRIVAFTFIENPNNLPQVNHIDENKLNNHIENLEWQTAKENMNFGTRLSRQLQNSKHYHSSERIKEIAIANGKKACKPVIQCDVHGNEIKRYNSAKEVNKLFGFNASHISECCKGKLKTSNGFIWKYKEAF